MNLNLIKYIGDSAKRILTTSDLQNLGATGDELKSLSGNSVLTFVKDAVHDVEAGLARFIANHPTLANEFHLLSDDEAAAADQATNPVTEGAAPASTEPAGTTPTETNVPTVEPTAETSPVETDTTESAVATDPSPATTEVEADTTNQSA